MNISLQRLTEIAKALQEMQIAQLVAVDEAQAEEFRAAFPDWKVKICAAVQLVRYHEPVTCIVKTFTKKPAALTPRAQRKGWNP